MNSEPSANAARLSQSPPDLRSEFRHTVQFYYDDSYLLQSLSEFVRSALAAGKSVVVIATRSHRLDLADGLRQQGVNLTLAIEHGRYLTRDANELLDRIIVNGVPDPKLFAGVIGELVDVSRTCATATCDQPLAIFEETLALLLERHEARAAPSLEQLWNQFSLRYSFQLLCAYRIASFDSHTDTEIFLQICAEHDIVFPAEGYPEHADENARLRTIAVLQQTEQVLKKEAGERHMAEAQSREVESEKQRLLQEIRKHESVEQDLRKFTRRLLTARDEEQRRIASELHENMAQLVAALSLYFGVLNQEKASLNPRLAKAVASSRSISDNLLNEIRRLSRLLHPPTLDDMGLGSALKEYVDQKLSSRGVPVELEISPDLGRFDRDFEITVYRIIEEALSNINPRSEGAFAGLRLIRSESSLFIEIESHSSGNAGEASQHRSEKRFTGIHERVLEHGGTVHFTSNPTGTLISVTLPLPRKQPVPFPQQIPKQKIAG
jgi:signal transduction histidine kinase